MKKRESPRKKSFYDIIFEVLYLTPGRKGISRFFRFITENVSISPGNTVFSGQMRVYDCIICSNAKDKKELKANFDLLIEIIIGDQVHQQKSITTDIFGQEFNHN